MVFHKRRAAQRWPAEQSRRQSQLVQSAWRHFGGAEPVIAFLNTRHDALEAQPLHLAIESDEGLRARRNLARANDAAGMMIFTEKTDETGDRRGSARPYGTPGARLERTNLGGRQSARCGSAAEHRGPWSLIRGRVGKFRRDAMENSGDSTGTSFTPFRSAAEEAAMKRGEQSWDNEGGHMSSTAGQHHARCGRQAPLRGRPLAPGRRSHRTCLRDDASGRSLHQAQHARDRAQPFGAVRPAFVRV